MAGGAKGNEQTRPMDSRAAMVNGEGALGPTAAAAPAIASEDLLAVTGEAAAGMGLARVARDTQAAGVELGSAAGAEQPGLPGNGSGLVGRERGRRGRICDEKQRPA